MPGPKKGKGPNRTSDAARARAVELERQGLTHERIVAMLRAEGLGAVGRSTLTKILIAARADPPPRQPPTSRARRAEAPPRPAEDMPLDSLSGGDIVRARLGEVRAFIAEAAAQISAGKATVYKDLVKLETELAARLVALEPPPPPDPALDPANEQALGELLAETRRQVDAIRGRAA